MFGACSAASTCPLFAELPGWFWAGRAGSKGDSGQSRVVWQGKTWEKRKLCCQTYPAYVLCAARYFLPMHHRFWYPRMKSWPSLTAMEPMISSPSELVVRGSKVGLALNTKQSPPWLAA